MTDKLMQQSDLILAEARLIAIELIEIELNKENLPLPKDTALDFHVEELLRRKPDILETARARVEAKADAYRESLAAVGIQVQVIEMLDL